MSPDSYIFLYAEKCWSIEISVCFFFFFFFKVIFWLGASQVAQMVKNLSAMQEAQVPSLFWEDPLEKEMATHSSILAWRIPWIEEPGGLQSMVFTGFCCKNYYISWLLPYLFRAVPQSSLEFSENPLNKTYFSTCSMCIFFPPLPTSVVFLLLLDNLPNKLPGQSPCLGLCSQENQAESRYEKCTRLIHIQQT